MAFNRAYIRKQAGLVIDPNEPGLVAAYNMLPQNGILPDLSNNTNDGTIEQSITFTNTNFGNCLFFSDQDFGVNIPSSPSLELATNITISVFVDAVQLNHPAGANSPRILDKVLSYTLFVSSAGSIKFVSNNLADSSLDSANGTFANNVVNHIVCTYDSVSGDRYIYYNGVVSISDNTSGLIGINSNPLDIGNSNISNRAWYGNIYQVKIFNVTKDAIWVANEYGTGREALFRSDWGATVSASPSSACLENTPCRVLSGSYKISNDTIGSTPVKVIECVTAGQILIPSGFFTINNTQNAYGDFDWWMRKGGDGNTSTLKFISNSAGTAGYSLSFNANESVSLDEIGVGTLFSTPAGYISNGQWYNPRVQRRYAGEFTGYLDSVLIDPTGGSGTNPVTDTTTTTSDAVIADLDAGDKVSWSDQNGDHSLIKRILP